MKGQTYVILTILFIIIISVFAVLNVATVEVNYIFWKGESPLIFVILFSVLLGGVLTMVVSSKRYFSLRRENRRLSEKINQLEISNKDRNGAVDEIELPKNKVGNHKE